MLEGKLAFVQNRVHGTSSRYKLATTNQHGQGFSIGKLATVSFTSSISMCVYARRKRLSVASFSLILCHVLISK